MARRVPSCVNPSLRGMEADARFPGIAVDFQAMDVDDLECHPDERGCGLCDQALVDEVLVDPVADLQLIVAQARVQACPTQLAGPFLVEDPIDIILLEVEHTAEPFDPCHLHFEWLRLGMGPGHPGLEMFDVFSDRLGEQRCIGRFIAAHHQARCLDPVGGIGDVGLAHFFLDAFLRGFGFRKLFRRVDSSFSSPICPLKYSFIKWERRKRRAMGATSARSEISTSSRPSAAA